MKLFHASTLVIEELEFQTAFASALKEMEDDLDG